MPRVAAAADCSGRCNGRCFERVSVSSGGLQGDRGSLLPYLSSDGCTVAFKSDATNLVLTPNDTNNATDVFVRIRDHAGNDYTIRASVDWQSHETPAEAGPNFPPVLSADGNVLAFASPARLTLDDTNDVADIFVRTPGENGQPFRDISRVSVGQGIGHEGSAEDRDVPPSVNADGRLVAFASPAPLTEKDRNSESDVFVFDRAQGVTELISQTVLGPDSGKSPTDGVSTAPVLSGNGRYVGFLSNAHGIVAGDDPMFMEVFVWDRCEGSTPEEHCQQKPLDQRMERITVTFDGGVANGDSQSLTITDDGRYVAFASTATNLAPGDDPSHAGPSQVFIRDRLLQRTTRVEPPSGCDSGGGVAIGAGAIRPNGASNFPSFSGDGRFLAFESEAANFLAPGTDTNQVADVFVLDRSTGQVARMLGEGNVEPNKASTAPRIAGDGRWIAFESDADNLLGPSGDTNNARDVFVGMNPFLAGDPIPGVTPLPTCTPTPSASPPPSPTPTATTTPTPIRCVGDCNGDGQVSVDELVKGVNMALGTMALNTCSAFDCNGNGRVTVDCLVKAVNNALCGCGGVCPPPLPTPTPPVSPSPTPTATPTRTATSTTTATPTRTPTRTGTATRTPTSSPSRTPTRTATNSRCANIAGSWTGTETGSITCTEGGDSETFPINQSGTINMQQNGCNVSYTMPGTRFTRSGTVGQSTIHMTGACAELAGGCTVSRNLFTGDGTVQGNTMHLTGTCAVNAVCNGVSVTCTGGTTATMQRLTAQLAGTALNGEGRTDLAPPLSSSRRTLRLGLMTVVR